MPRPSGIIGRVSRPDMPVCGLFHVRGAPEIQGKFTGAAMHTPRPSWVRCGGVGYVPRASASPSIADVLLHCHEPPLGAKYGHSMLSSGASQSYAVAGPAA